VVAERGEGEPGGRLVDLRASRGFWASSSCLRSVQAKLLHVGACGGDEPFNGGEGRLLPATFTVHD